MSDSFNRRVPDENQHLDITAELMANLRQSREESAQVPEVANQDQSATSAGMEFELPPQLFCPYSFEDLFPEDDPSVQADEQAAKVEAPAQEEPRPERRRRHRALISAPIRVRGASVTNNGPDEISTTIDVSRLGILFETSNTAYFRGMEVAVTFPYVKSVTALQAEQAGLVVRVHELPGNRRTVAVALGVRAEADLVDSSGRKLAGDHPYAAYSGDSERKRPLVLAVDADAAVRDSLKTLLTNEGYEVIAVNNGPDAREVLKMFTPALVIAEIEGTDLPGYDICAHVKGDTRLKHIPVVLTTSSGYPSDYSNAHALGAVVCMAKPYKQERLGHVVRLLAPTTQAMARTAPVCAADPSRKPGANGKNGRGGNGSSGSSLFRIIRLM